MQSLVFCIQKSQNIVIYNGISNKKNIKNLKNLKPEIGRRHKNPRLRGGAPLLSKGGRVSLLYIQEAWPFSVTGRESLLYREPLTENRGGAYPLSIEERHPLL